MHQAGVTGKGYVAPLAFIRFLTRMDALVSCQSAFLPEAGITFPALVWLLSRVDTLVFFQIAMSCRTKITLTALIRLLTRVAALV